MPIVVFTLLQTEAEFAGNAHYSLCTGAHVFEFTNACMQEHLCSCFQVMHEVCLSQHYVYACSHLCILSLFVD